MFLNYLVARGWFTQKCRQAVSQANFGRDELGNIVVPVPPISRQTRFAGVYELHRKHRERRTKQHENAEELFARMIHGAFSGALTAKWRAAHIEELLQEMEQQARGLSGPPSTEMCS
jgi:type I restriction enzyme S subunit